MLKNILGATVCLTMLTGFGSKYRLNDAFNAEDTVRINANFVPNDVSQVEVFLSGVQLKFLKKLNLHSVDLCTAAQTCSRLEVGETELQVSKDIFLTNANIASEETITLAAINVTDSDGQIKQLASTQLSENLVLENGRRKALFLADLKFQGKKTKLSDLGNDFVPPSYDYVTAVKPGKPKRLSFDAHDVELKLDVKHYKKPVIVSGSLQANALGEIAISVDYRDDVDNLATLEFKADDPDLLPGELPSFKVGELNDVPIDLKFIGSDRNKVQKYRARFPESGFFYLRNKGPFEMEASGLSQQQGLRTGTVSTPQDSSGFLQKSEASTLAAPTQLNLSNANDCATEIVAAGASAFYNAVTGAGGNALFSSCKNITKLHIVIQETNKPGFDVDYIFNSPLSSGERLTETVNDHVGSSPRYLSINAFTWDGNRGFRFDGDPSGTPDADQWVDGTQINSSSDQQVLMGFSNPANTTNAFPFFLDKPANTSGVPSSVFNHDVVGSTASIIKNSTCNANNTSSKDRRNAMGVVDRGTKRYLVTIQTRRGAEAGLDEICDVFLALEVPNAMQLDGGSAAQMVINGILINPLEKYSLKWWALGEQRRVISALSMGQ